MDATGAIVVLIFIVTMFSSLGGKNDVQQSSVLPKYTQSEVVGTPPPSNYIGSVDDQTQNAIAMFVRTRATKVSKEEADEMIDSIMKYCQQYDVNPRLIAALIFRESGFDPSSVSPSNAQGLAQLLPSTSAHIGINDPFSIDDGVKGATLYIKMMLDKWVGKPDQVALAIASYNEGPNQVARNGATYSPKTALYVNDIISLANNIR